MYVYMYIYTYINVCIYIYISTHICMADDMGFGKTDQAISLLAQLLDEVCFILSV